jgi:acyl-ACP thioesterase
MDILGHLNNAAYWEAVEEMAARKGLDLSAPLETVLEYRRPIDLEDEVELLYSAQADGFRLAFAASGSISAVTSLRLKRPGD